MEAHDTWREDYNVQRHWAHEEREDGRHSPRAVLGFYTGPLRYREEDLHRAFFSIRFSRDLDALDPAVHRPVGGAGLFGPFGDGAYRTRLAV